MAAYLEDTQRNRDVIEDTFRVALLLYGDVRRQRGRALELAEASNTFWASAPFFEDRLIQSGLVWDERMRAYVRNEITPRRTDNGEPKYPYAPLIGRAIRVGLALATGREADLPQGLARWGADTLAKLGVTVPAKRLRTCDRTVHPSVPSDGEVPFVLALSKPGRTVEEVYQVTGTCLVQPLTEEEAPVVARLTGRGAPIPIRRSGDVFLRPVLAPGGWDPMDLAAFRHAASCGDAWRDDPFADPSELGGEAVGVNERASSPTKDTSHGREMAKVALEAALRRAGTLHLIDGMVYRSCEAPRLALFEVKDGHTVESTIVVGWSLGGNLDSMTDQSVQKAERPRTHGSDLLDDMRLPLLDGPAHADLRRHLPELEPSRTCQGASDLDPVLLDIDPRTALDDLCQALRSNVLWTARLGGGAIADAAEAMALGRHVEMPGCRDGDKRHRAYAALAGSMASRIRDAELRHDEVATLVL